MRIKSQWARFAPTLAGATPGGALLASLGAFLGVGLAGLLGHLALSGSSWASLIVAPIGASAVLLFAVPSSPLAQPWPIIGGNVLSALVGISVGQAVGDPVLATGVAVALAILVMSMTHCLHPPGGAVALMTVMATQQNGAADFFYAFAPVGLNSAALVALGLVFHRFTRHSYPHVPAARPAPIHGTQDTPPQRRGGFQVEDIDEVLAELHESFDIDRDDLELLLQRVESRVFMRARGPLTCADIMSLDLICVGEDETLDAARALMRARRLRCMPVVNRLGLLVGMVTAGDLIVSDAMVAAVMREALTAAPDQKALTLVSFLTTGAAHEVAVIDADRRVLGLITQTDLLVALARLTTEA
jgi:CBS domain-containing membrane protein